MKHSSRTLAGVRGYDGTKRSWGGIPLLRALANITATIGDIVLNREDGNEGSVIASAHMVTK